MAANPRAGRPRISDKTDKPRDTGYVLKGLWKYVSHFKFHLILAIILTIGSNLLALVGPHVIRFCHRCH